MANKYVKQFAIPDGFPDVLKAFTREVLRAQPDDIYDFGSKYFCNILAAQGQQYDDAAGGEEDMHAMLSQLFDEADADGNGYLDPVEFKNLLKNQALGLSSREIRKIMMECDEDSDGMIDYNEFLPIAVEMLQAYNAKMDAIEGEEMQKIQAFEEANAMIYGMNKEELEDMFHDLFQEADKDGNGTLDRKELRAVLADCSLHLSKKEVNAIVSQLDMDGDGNVSYEELCPLMYDLFVQLAYESTMEGSLPADVAAFTAFIVEQAAGYDQANTGFVSPDVLKTILYDWPLSRLQISAILSECVYSETEDDIDVEASAPTVARMCLSMLHPDAIMERAMVAKDAMEADPSFAEVHGQDAAGLEGLLMSAFSAADHEATGSLSREEFKGALDSSAVPFASKEVSFIMDLVWPMGDDIDYGALAKAAHGQLVKQKQFAA